MDKEFLGTCPICGTTDVSCVGYGEYTNDYECGGGHTWQTLTKEFIISDTVKDKDNED